jgi:hypothetical protein
MVLPAEATRVVVLESAGFAAVGIEGVEALTRWAVGADCAATPDVAGPKYQNMKPTAEQNATPINIRLERCKIVSLESRYVPHASVWTYLAASYVRSIPAGEGKYARPRNFLRAQTISLYTISLDDVSGAL